MKAKPWSSQNKMPMMKAKFEASAKDKKADKRYGQPENSATDKKQDARDMMKMKGKK